MRRRTWSSLIAVVPGATRVQAEANDIKPIQLNCDRAVDPAMEKEFVACFENVFQPVAKKHTGSVDLKLPKLNTAVREGVTSRGRFRFSLTYQSEELRQKWIASDDHAKNWPPMENMLTDKNFGIPVYDIY